MVHELSFQEIVRTRRATRAFADEPVPEALLRTVLEDAQQAPSNVNTQPWITHIVGGEVRDRMSAELHAAVAENRQSLDFAYDKTLFTGIYGERKFALGKYYYEALGVAREDRDGRNAVMLRNFDFYDAPLVAFLFMPEFGGERVAADVGMYAQTLLLSLTAHGLAGIPQTSIGCYADTVRAVLDIPTSQKLLFGISFGYPDKDWARSFPRVGRAEVDENVTFHT